MKPSGITVCLNHLKTWIQAIAGLQVKSVTILVIALIALTNLSVWAFLNQPAHEEDWRGVIGGLSYSPYQRGQDPFKEKYPSIDDIASDMRFLKGKTSSVRTYSSINGVEETARLAKEQGIFVTAGAWLDKRKDNNEREINSLIQLAKKYDNIERVIVGNESVLRGDLTVKELAEYIRRVKKEVKVPVSTAEPWHVWLTHRELADEVDYIAIHVLPYWEKIPANQAVDWALSRYEQVKQTFPGKHVIFGEVGWPSGGNRLEAAEPSLTNQARFIRKFLNIASREKIDYFIMEAFDQPWKRPLEGPAGMHWGIFNVDRMPKFPFTGEISENPFWAKQAIAATLFAMLPMFLFLFAFKEIRLPGQVVFAGLIQITASLAVWTGFVPVVTDLPIESKAVWFALFPAQLLLLGVVLVNGFEFTEIIWKPGFKRLFRPFTKSDVVNKQLPMVSIHLPICNEPPDMVIQSLNSLARLDYQNYEVLVIDNNTKDEAVWKPVERHCASLGARFRFFHLPKWPGFKAGALNFALTQMSPDAEIVGVVDSDYVVRPDWLLALTPYFENEKVGFVQAPQDNRDWIGNPFKTMCNWEYSGFFHIGMMHRNERNAIIQHGTMTLVRKTALNSMGNWSEWCICEDADLGLRMLNAGYDSVYVNDEFGKGVTPDSFAAYQKQRFRWAYGAMQIIKGHWRLFLPRFKTNSQDMLNNAQRYHFASGWMPWFADALHLIFAMAGIFWTAALCIWPQYFEFPLAVFLAPTLGIFAFKVLHSFLLYKYRVPCTLTQRIGAAIAGMALTHTIAKAVIAGLFTSKLPFMRTPKGESTAPLLHGFMVVREELAMFLLLMLGAANIWLVYGTKSFEINAWAVILLIQSIPYLAAIICSLASSMPNAFSFKWARRWLDAFAPQLQAIKIRI
ncbi:MAG: glycosyltransferase [Dissulfuribacterales bacterium]